jgi:hypothetical protein
MAAVYNWHVPPLRGTALEDTLACLQSNEGVDTETFWQEFDMCNCSCFFTKETLHFVHGTQCPLWVYNDASPA